MCVCPRPAHLAGVALLVQLAQTAPLTQQGVRLHLDDGDVVGLAQSLHQLLVRLDVAVGRQHAQTRHALVQHLGAPVASNEDAIRHDSEDMQQVTMAVAQAANTQSSC